MVLLFFALFSAVGAAGIEYDPDMFRNVSELISSKGYPVEEYDVQTTDGYLLSIQRIPGSKNSSIPSNGKVVFLQHGLLGCSSDWVTNLANQSLGFLLADAGYDVWLGNVRGTTYAKRHIKFPSNSKEFWNFSMDEMSDIDLPNMVDFVLNKTGKSQLYYIGHSQGTHIAFAHLSENPAFNKKIKLYIALAPVATVGYIKSPIRYFAPFTKEVEILFSLFGVRDFLPNDDIMKILSKLVCDTEIQKLCEEVMFLIGGPDPAQMNMTRIPVYVTHDPAGTSVKNIVHWAQMVNSKKFTKYDYGATENAKRYGQNTPPEYHVENITTPIALFWSGNDWLADPTDVSLLIPRIHNLVESYPVAFAQWSHLDFIWGMDAPALVYEEVLRLLKNN